MLSSQLQQYIPNLYVNSVYLLIRVWVVVWRHAGEIHLLCGNLGASRIY